MPITRFSWAALREHVRRYLWIYIAGIALCLVGTELLWTTTRPRVPAEQAVLVYLADGYTDSAALDAVAADMLERGRARDGTLRSVEFQSLPYGDPASDYTGGMVLLTRLSGGDGDAFLAGPYAAEALVAAGAALPLDDLLAAGWLADLGLEPYSVTVPVEPVETDPFTGEPLDPDAAVETVTYVAGLRLDPVDSLRTLGAMENRGACLMVAVNGTNPETTLYTLELMLEDLMREDGHAPEDTEPAA